MTLQTRGGNQCYFHEHPICVGCAQRITGIREDAYYKGPSPRIQVQCEWCGNRNSDGRVLPIKRHRVPKHIFQESE